MPPRIGSRSLGEFPFDVVLIENQRCGAWFRPDAALFGAQRWVTYRRRSAVGDLFLGPYPALIASLTSKRRVRSSEP